MAALLLIGTFDSANLFARVLASADRPLLTDRP
jgi:hypothetical protein